MNPDRKPAALGTATLRSLLLGVLAMGVLLALAWVSFESSARPTRTESTSQDLESSAGPLGHDESPRTDWNLYTPATGSPDREEVEEAVEPAPAEEGAGPDSKALARALRSAVEMSLFDQMDPGAILETALKLCEYQVDDRAIPDPDPSGRLRFPLLHLPEGMRAEFVVAKPKNPLLPQFYGIDVEMDRPFEPYYLEGAARKAPKVQIGVWSDPDGSTSHFALTCSVEPSRSDSLAAGLPFGQGRTTWNLHYSLNVADPTDSKMTATRLVDGMLMDEEVPVTLQGSAWPRTDDIGMLGRKLATIHGQLKGK